MTTDGWRLCDGYRERTRVGTTHAHEQEQLNSTSPDILSSASSRDFDETYEVYKQQDARDIDPQEARRVLRKIDLHILPLLMVTYMLQYLDKTSINFAEVYGLEPGLNLQGQDYAWFVNLFEILCTCSPADDTAKAFFNILFWLSVLSIPRWVSKSMEIPSASI